MQTFLQDSTCWQLVGGDFSKRCFQATQVSITSRMTKTYCTPLTRLGSRKGIESWSQSTELDCKSFWAGCIICVESKRPPPSPAGTSFLPLNWGRAPFKLPSLLPAPTILAPCKLRECRSGNPRLAGGEIQSRSSQFNPLTFSQSPWIWDCAIERSRQLSVAICWWHNP